MLVACHAYGKGQVSEKWTVKVLYYRDGNTAGLINNKEKVVMLAEDIFNGSDDTYRMVITDELIKDLKKSDAVEVVYAEPKGFRSAYLGRDVKVTRLLVPLSGRFASQGATVFYADPEYGEFNVLVNKQGGPSIKRIKELLK